MALAHGTNSCYVNSKCRCSVCVEAHAAYGRVYYQSNCEELKVKASLYRKVNPDKVAAAQHSWYTRHCEERREYGRLLRDKYSAEFSERDRSYHRVHRESRNESCRAWYAANRDYSLKRSQCYREANRDKFVAYASNRKARKLSAGGTYTGVDVLLQYDRQKGKCFWGVLVNPLCVVDLVLGYHVDHVVPLSLGGSNGPENIVLACPSCNMKKNASHPMDWAGVML